MKTSSMSLPGWIWVVYILLFIFSIPWYLPDRQAMVLVFGLPLWLVCSIISMLSMGVFSVYVIQVLWVDPEDIKDGQNE